MRDFLAAIESRGKTVADIEEGHISTASCILAKLAMKLNRPFSYDASGRIVVGDEEATRLLKIDDRPPGSTRQNSWPVGRDKAPTAPVVPGACARRSKITGRV